LEIVATIKPESMPIIFATIFGFEALELTILPAVLAD
jgi:hypothetical protein